ncbi:hypothetical protein HBB16_15470 [Pseudonocardia sp. MCCB 268]|nr:hypothetical protein [Pseudonocardia cytotoxica]
MKRTGDAAADVRRGDPVPACTPRRDPRPGRSDFALGPRPTPASTRSRSARSGLRREQLPFAFSVARVVTPAAAWPPAARSW